MIRKNILIYSILYENSQKHFDVFYWFQKKKKKKQKNVVSDKSHKLLTRKDREIFNEQYKSGGIIR